MGTLEVQEGGWIWVKGDIWLAGSILSTSGGNITIKVDNDELIKVPYSEMSTDKYSIMHNTSVTGVPDMASLGDLHEGAILHNLKLRYFQNSIYSYIGSILVAVNPYKPISGLYSQENLKKYSKAYLGEQDPHIYAIANEAYRNLWKTDETQCVLISGESGAGKTESTKMILDYLSEMSAQNNNGEKSLVSSRILSSSPILEAFGNAKTVYNHNSSRFGKFIQLYFSDTGIIIGGNISHYLLEKNRTVGQNPGERNYHIFYQLLLGITEPLRSKLNLVDPKMFRYLAQAGCVRDPNLEGKKGKMIQPEDQSDIKPAQDKADYRAVIESFEVMGLSNSAVEEMLTILAGLLHLGNTTFHMDGGAQIDDRKCVELAATYLSISVEQLTEGLTQNKRELRGEVMLSPLNLDQANTSRDSITMAVYSYLFDWIIQRINSRIKTPTKHHSSIGVLDIFGFENFRVNRFEQFNINFANEKLQQYFNKHIFSLEQLEYNQEGIAWADIVWTDNGGCIDLVERKMGVLAIIDEESRFPKGTDKSMLEKLHNAHQTNKFYIKPKVAGCEFGVRHYAGDVVYQTTGFLDKNRGSFRDDLILMLKDSKSDFLFDLFDGVKLSSENTGRGKKKASTVASQFKESLSSLMQTLSTSNPFFVRCVKPNAEKQANEFKNQLMVNQLRYSGMMQTVVIRRSGYPVRRLFSDFAVRYRALLVKIYTQVPKDKAVSYLKKLDPSNKEWQCGKTKIFMKETLENRLEQERTITLGVSATKIQTMWRGYYCRKLYQKRLSNIIKVQALVRAFLYRRLYLRTRRAALIVQKHVRGLLARQRVADLWAEKCEKLEAELKAQKEALEARKAQMEQLLKEEQTKQAEALRKQLEDEELARKKGEEERKKVEEMRMKEAMVRMEEKRAEEERIRIEDERRLVEEEMARLAQEKVIRERQEAVAEEERQAAILAAEAKEAEEMGLQDDTFLLDQAEKEIFGLLGDLDQTLQESVEEEEEWWEDDGVYSQMGDSPEDRLAELSEINDLEESTAPVHAAYLKVRDVSKLSKWRQKYCMLQGDSLLIFNAKQEYLKSGWLTKKGGGKGTLSRRNWLPRFFVLQSTILSYFEFEGGEVKGTINLRQVLKILEHPLKDKKQANYIGIVTPERTYEIIAEDENEHRSWLRVLREVHTTSDTQLSKMKEEMNPRNAVASINLIELESCNRIDDKSEDHAFCVITNDRVHYFAADDSEEMFRWIDLLSPQDIAIKQSVLESGYLNLVKSKLMNRKVYSTLTERGIEMYKRKNGPLIGKVSLHSLCVVTQPEESGGDWYFNVHVRKRSYCFSTKSAVSASRWVEGINELLDGKEQFQTRTEKLIPELRNLRDEEIDDVYRKNAILRFTRAPIQTPLLALPYGPASKTGTLTQLSLQEEAVRVYKNFLNYEGVPAPVEFMEQNIALLFEVPQLRDEVFCQLIKQTAFVRDVDTPQNLRYWMFLVCILAVFPPSRKVLRYLKLHLQRNMTIYSGTEMYKSAVYADGLLSLGLRQREFVPSSEELKKIMFLKDMPTVVHCYGGGSCKITLTPTITAREAVGRLLSGMRLNPGNNKYAMFEKCNNVYKVIEDRTVLADVLAKFQRKYAIEEPDQKWCIFFKLFGIVEVNISKCDPLELIFLYEQVCDQIRRGLYPDDKISLHELAAMRCQYLYGDYKPNKEIVVSDIYPVTVPVQNKRKNSTSSGGTLRGLGTLGKGTLRKLKDFYIEEKEEDEKELAEEEAKAKDTITDVWKNKSGLSKGAAQQELLKITTRWLAFGYGIFEVELSDNRFRDTELWLAVGHNDIAIYQRRKSLPLEVYTYDSVISFGAPTINTFKVSIEGTDPLEMQTPEFLDIARLMKTYISIMVRRKRESTAS